MWILHFSFSVQFLGVSWFQAFLLVTPFSCVVTTRVFCGMTTLMNAVAGEEQMFAGSLVNKLQGIGKLKKLFWEIRDDIAVHCKYRNIAHNFPKVGRRLWNFGLQVSETNIINKRAIHQMCSAYWIFFFCWSLLISDTFFSHPFLHLLDIVNILSLIFRWWWYSFILRSKR